MVEAEKRAGKELWEWWLDALKFRSDSAGRLHIRQMLAHPNMTPRLRSLFNALDLHRRGALDSAAIVRFSAGIQGTVRVLLEHRPGLADHEVGGRGGGGGGGGGPQHHHRSGIDIPPASQAEHDFLVRHLDLLFPPEAPLDLPAFLSLAKLVLVRRIVKALVRHHGLHSVQRWGNAASPRVFTVDPTPGFSS